MHYLHPEATFTLDSRINNERVKPDPFNYRPNYPLEWSKREATAFGGPILTERRHQLLG